MKLESKKYIYFSFALFCLQTLGYNVVALGILILSLIPICSFQSFLKSIQNNFWYFTFLYLSFTIGLYHFFCNGLSIWNITYWGQFYFLSYALLAIKDKECAFEKVKYCVYAIYIADIFTNILSFAGVNLPWAEVGSVRPGESMTRYGGIKNSALYSGSLTFITLCYLLQENIGMKLKKYIYCLLACFNLILSGSYRYFIICLIVLVLYFVHLYKHRLLLMCTYILSIVIVYVSTLYTMLINQSNFLRALIWEHTMQDISLKPLLGHGFYNMHLDDNQDFSYTQLVASGVTESCILLIGYNFGIIVLFLYFICLACVLLKFNRYNSYHAALGIFIGLSLDLFWGGSFDNSLSFSLLTLSIYIINNKFTNQIETLNKK